MKGQSGGTFRGDDILGDGAPIDNSRPIDTHAIDMDAIRDTLRYIESDLREPQHAELRTILKLALMEIARIEAMHPVEAPRILQGARYLPANI
jgi:hypothetical protein